MATPTQGLPQELATDIKRSFEDHIAQVFSQVPPGELQGTELQDATKAAAAELSNEQLQELAAAQLMTEVLKDTSWVTEHVRQGGGQVMTNGFFEVERVISKDEILGHPLS